MRSGNAANFKTWEWATIFGTVAIAIALATVFDLEEKWRDAIVYTMMLFTALVMALRPAWGRRVFWRNILAVLVLHVIIVIGIVQAIPLGFVIPKLLFIPLLMVEGILIAAALWKRTVRARSPRE